MSLKINIVGLKYFNINYDEKKLRKWGNRK